MNRLPRRHFLVSAGALLAAPRAVNAQAKKQYRVGFLTGGDPAQNPELPRAWRQGLRELGWVEGQNLVIEYRWAAGNFDRLPGLAADLVRLKVDVIVATSTQPALAAQHATRTIPIITVVVGDPVASGLAASLARPEGNVTGLTLLAGAEMGGKLLELLKESLPEVSRMAVLWNPGNSMHAPLVAEAHRAAGKLKVEIQPVAVGNPETLEGAFAPLTRDRQQALLIVPDALFFFSRQRILDFAAKHSLPTMWSWREAVQDGGLMAYGPVQTDLFYRAAAYVDKILKGVKPAELSFQRPTLFEFVVNLKTAKALGLTIPSSVLVRADALIR